MKLTIQSRKAFSTGAGKPALGVEGVDETGARLDGVFWDHPLIPSLNVGTTVELHESGKLVSLGDYKGIPRVSVNEKAQVTILSTGAAAPQTAPAASGGFGSPRPAATPSAGAQGARTANTGEQILDRAAELTEYFFKALQEKGMSPEQAIQIAGLAPDICAKFWFGERSC